MAAGQPLQRLPQPLRAGEPASPGNVHPYATGRHAVTRPAPSPAHGWGRFSQAVGWAEAEKDLSPGSLPVSAVGESQQTLHNLCMLPQYQEALSR